MKDDDAYERTAAMLKAGYPAPQPSALDTQEGGTHYKDLAIQPVEYIHRNGIDYLTGNVIKYASRHSRKNGAEDIRKAIHYCELILEMVYAERR